MKKKMFGYRSKKRSDSERVPGEPINEEGMDRSYQKVKDSPPKYEGKEHVKYRNPGFSKHHIRFPEDEPHMKSYNSKEEAHEMEDNYHMDVPDQTETTLEAKLKRARMKMDAPDQEDPKPLRGNITHNVPYKGEEDTSGEEEEGPNDMQSNESKEKRKKMIIAVTRKKIKKSKY